MRKVMVITREWLYPRVEKALRKRFTKFDGWYLIDRPQGKSGPDFTFALDRKHQQKVICIICTDTRLTDSILEQIQNYEKAASGKNVEIFARIIAVPDEVSIPSDLKRKLEKEGIEVLRIPTAL